ncbi:unnamed protein product [Prorocentrum cordatum]|uniref:Calmodulin n=3 Tax=Prorocentrum cordatum TaxID=2364126 RepID=A0ABN9UXR7_9DINO|nr:unnamed protein product [Polarella glacialis]
MSGFTMQLVIRRLTMAFALCGGVCADLQLMNRSSHDYVVQPRAGCRTAVAGDHCYDKVSWAMLTGVQKYPDWFSPLTSSSSFEDFQRHLHAMPKFSNVCPEPCAARAMETPAVQAQLPASASCQAPIEGDECHKRVVWAMEKGVVKYPAQFAPLTSSSSFDDFQRHLHAMPKFSNVCPEPCAARAVETPAVQAQLPASASCQAPIEGDECHKRVVWAMEKGAVKYPAQFAPLTSSSSFEDFQRHLHAMPKFSNVCPEPCAARAVEIVVPAPLPQVCHTSVDGEACYRKVMWAMESGVAKYPDWFFPLTNTSKFEDVQRHLHGIPKFSIVCPEPCAARAVEVREPIQVPARDSAKPTERAVRTRMEGSNQTGDPWIVNGYDQTGSNCECGNIIQSLPTGYETPLLCASACNMYPRCMSIGVHEDTIWPGHCDLFDAPCNDTDGHDEAGTTCAKPVHEQGISLNFNRVQTDSPTPSPTPAPDACEIANGTGPSVSYPCACGPVVCGTSEICSNATCSPPSYLHVDWPCSWPSIGDPNFIISGTSAGGAPIYVNFHGSYIYFDESCDGEVREGDSRVPRWIIDDSAPSVSAVMDLDSDRSCSYYGHYESDDSHGLPLGSSTWVTFCEGVLQAVTAEITYLHEEPNVTATPAPTLPPGTACPCDQKCAGFPYVDTDGDGCLSEPECKYLPPVIGNFGELDLDGDGCVTLNECVESPLGEFLPMFPISAPNHCDFGHYFTPGTSLCVVCTNGETRRRRSEACTKCPPGRDDFGDFDTCIGGAYLKEPLYPGNCTACVNSDTDENGQTLTRGDSVVISTRNPDPGHYEIVTIIGKITVDNQTCFHVEPCVNDSYDPYDSLISDCTEHDGRSTSSTYPCGCGVDECAEGEVCDLDGNAGRGICIPPSWTVPTPAPTVSARGDPHLVNLHGEHFDVNHGGDFTLLRIPQAQSEPPMVKLKASVRPEHGRPCTTYITEVEVSGSLLGGRTLQVRSYLRAHAENETDKFLGVRVLDRTPGAAIETPWERLAQVVDSSFFVTEPQPASGFRVTMSTTKWYSNKEAGEDVPKVAGQVEVRLGDPEDLGLEPARILVRQDLPRQEHLNVAVRRLSSLGREDIGGLLGFDPHPESLEAVTPECERHRGGLDRTRGPRSRPGWRARWEKIKARRGQAPAPEEGTGDDNEAAAALFTAGREAMCVCPGEEPPMISEGESAQSLLGGRGGQGVVVEHQTGRLAEASWD